jgi:hypothetical protein
MIKGTQIHLSTVLLIALPSFINIVMIIVFLPAVAELTPMHIMTPALLITFNGLIFKPVWTICLLVLQPLIQEQLSPKILLIMGIDTGFPVMLDIEGAKHSLVAKYIKLLVLFHKMQQLDPELIICVDERAVRPILAIRQKIGVVGAETSFEPFRVVHLFSLVVRVPT